MTTITDNEINTVVWTCKYCFIEFTNKPCWEEHKICCEFMYERAKKRNTTHINNPDDKIPNERMTYELIKHLMYECELLKKKVKDLQDRTQKQRRKIDIMAHLQQQHQQPDQTFIAWIKTIEIGRSHLEATIDRDIIKGVCEAIGDLLEITDNAPITAFSHKHNVFYVYETGESDIATWKILSDTLLEQVFDILSNRIYKAYTKWEETDPTLQKETEEVQNRRTFNRQKVLGNTICEETKYRKFKNWMYVNIKKNVSSITEYEFV